jgi:hypothetical protein
MRRVWLRVTVLFGASVLALVGVELALRVSAPPTVEGARLPGELDASCASTHPTRGWTPRAGACGRDAQGLLHTPPTAAPDALTVLLEGDSVGEKAWAHVLPDVLAARMGRPVVLLNGAVSGYHTCQEADALRAHLAGARVDAVIVQTCANDLLGSVTALPDDPGGALSPAWSVVRVGVGWRRVPSRLLDTRIVQHALARIAGSSAGARLTPALATRCAGDMAARAAGLGVPLVAVHFPALVDPGETAPHLTRLRVEESAVRAAWSSVQVAQVDGRAVLSTLGSLAALAPHDADRLHPRPEAGHPIAQALAEPVAAALRAR